MERSFYADVFKYVEDLEKEASKTRTCPPEGVVKNPLFVPIYVRMGNAESFDGMLEDIIQGQDKSQQQST